MYDLLMPFIKKDAPKTPQESAWSLWGPLEDGNSLFSRFSGGHRVFIWGENPYTAPVSNMHSSRESALDHYRKETGI